MQEAAMRLRAHRRDVVVWSHTVIPADRYDAPARPQIARTKRFRRRFRIGVLLMIVGLICLARGARPRWKPLLAAALLMAAGVALRGGAWGVLLLAGFWFLLYALLIPGSPDADRRRRAELERELAGYSTPAQRRDLEATLDRYPDGITSELRDILATQAMAACNNGIPHAGR
jgi:hypothetical protein